ncbi:aminotransferase class I/II-fold pyridoxal phosphate-dependent enzyme [Lentiprolixibacter aurantiacus]|uniref:Aminotransferase class I/II-fold pyridoxal phosphate-dependent enzyme n=1 Tax=Lentiprolixibacter aurantiacus TaxID=2993939 RepID=A0AAE3MNV4_9FLAO|nr:aminotransferase class I/II-fold pyridoxal phosphate-dependent enzyme [Lentiprolixibacter aurantiacus]MCX2720309.1 aminotransferase class I/II-fold pyridoxal phosphate-dependent enzyme [Lentiprolixibacter aurantiacus]
MEPLDHFPGTHIKIKEQSDLYFGGTAYLGLQTNPSFQKCYKENIDRYGTHYGASRNANVQIAIYAEAEQKLKEITASQAAITLSSGYLAGQILAAFFSDSDYTLFYTRESHSALYQKKIPAYASFGELRLALEKHLSTKESTPVIFMDTLENPEASYPEFDALRDLPLSECILVADDSHGFGVMGKEGTGAYPILTQFKPKDLLVCFSMGKAIGIPAGAVAGSKRMINQLAKSEIYGAASPASPAGLATFVQSLVLIWEKNQQLKGLTEYFLALLEQKHVFRFIPGQPAFAYKDLGLTEYLRRQNVLVTHFHYPNEQSEPTSRIVLTAAHSKAEISHLAQLINQYFHGH